MANGSVGAGGTDPAGEVSSREVVEAHLVRVDKVNGQLNAIVRLLADEALAAADAADRAVADGRDLGPLHGVPCTVKENIDVAGTPTTQGVLALSEAVAVRRRADRGPHARRRGDPLRPHQPPRSRPPHPHPLVAPRPHPQPLEPARDGRWFERR